MTLDQVLQSLRDEGFVVRDVSAPVGASSPWYIRAMLGFCGWIAGIMLFGSFTAAFAAIFNRGDDYLLLGLVMCAGAAFAFHKLRNDAAIQFALAVSMCGQILVFLGMADAHTRSEEATTAALLFAFQAVLVVVMRNSLHRTMSALFALGALAFAVGKWNHWALAGTAAALLYAEVVVNEAARRTSRMAVIVRPVLPALALAVVLWYIPTEWLDAPAYLRGGPMLAIGVSMALLVVAASPWRSATLNQRIGFVVGAALFCLGAWRSPGVIAGALVLAAGYRMGSRETMGLGVAGFVGYLAAHYYFLATTLLDKALSLALAGAVLLGAATMLGFMNRGAKP